MEGLRTSDGRYVVCATSGVGGKQSTQLNLNRVPGLEGCTKGGEAVGEGTVCVEGTPRGKRRMRWGASATVAACSATR